MIADMDILTDRKTLKALLECICYVFCFRLHGAWQPNVMAGNIWQDEIDQF